MPEMFAHVGWYWIPFLACSVAAAAVVIDRAWAMRRFRRDVEAWAGAHDGRTEDADLRASLRRDPHVVAQGARLLASGRPLDEAWGPAVARDLTRRMDVLGVVAYVAPLVGLLGTVTGMIVAFQQIQAASEAGRGVSAGELAGGIWEALATTAVGLFIALPTYVAHAALTGYANRALDRAEDLVRAWAPRIRGNDDRARTARGTATVEAPVASRGGN